MNIKYKQPLPDNPRPICIIGAGGIVKDAHLPAYHKAGFDIWSITDIKIEKAETLAAEYSIPRFFNNVADTVVSAPEDAVYDLALMPEQALKVLRQLPNGGVVLIQKPMGESFKQAKEIYELCKQKRLTAAVNFQLRFAPFVNAARCMIESGLIGELYDMEIRLTAYTPWQIFPSVMSRSRLEIMYHSIHYIDLIRSFLGEPAGVMAKTLRHPAKKTSSSRTSILFDYGNTIRAVINTNHDHEFGSEHQESFIKWEGTKGAIKAKMGLLLNYPKGVPDKFEYCICKDGKEPEWKEEQLEGSWFPNAFIGTMSSLMQCEKGTTEALPTGIDDALKTMAVVESAYRSDSRGGVPVDILLSSLK